MKNNLLKIPAVIIALAGTPIGFAMVDTTAGRWWKVICGIAIAFVLIGLFVWCLAANSKKLYRISSVITWILGGISCFLTTYRAGWSPEPPWRWDTGGYPAVVVGPYLEWPLAIMIWAVFAALGFMLFLLGTKQENNK